MKILITGASGFIGTKLVQRLSKTNHEVIPYSLQQKNLQDVIDILKFKRPEMIIHLGTHYSKDDTDIQSRFRMHRMNVQVPEYLLMHSSEEFGCKYFINTGSFFEYEQKDTPLTEWSPIKPYNYYAATKQMFEQSLKYQADAGRIKALTLRLFPVYGGTDRPTKIVPAMIRTLLEGGNLDLTSGHQQWNYTYVDDVVDAYMAAITAVQEMKVYSAYNIGSTETTCIYKMGMFLKERIGGNGSLIFGERTYSDNEIMHVSCNGTYSHVMLGWSAKTNISEGLLRSIEEYHTCRKSTA